MVKPVIGYTAPVTPATGYDPRKLGALCDQCPLQSCKPIPSDQRQHATLAIVGEAPGVLETQLGKYFVGESGKLLKRSLRQLAVAPRRVHINNALQCMPPIEFEAKDWNKAIQCCRPRLTHELRWSNAVYILAAGKRAFHATTKYKSAILGRREVWVGGTIPCNLEGCEKKTVLVTVHPAFILRGSPQYLPVFNQCLQHAWRLSTRRQIPFQWPELLHYGSDEQCTINALREIANSNGLLGFDIETAGSCPITDPLIAVGVANADLAVSLGWPLSRQFKDQRQERQAHALLRAIFKKTTLHKIAHNGSHDVPGLEINGFKIHGYKHDTILYHAVYANTLRHSLDFVSQVEFACKPWKPLFKAGGDVKGLARFTTSPLEELTRYNAEDSAILVPLTERALNHWIPNTHNGQSLYDGYFERAAIATGMMQDGTLINTEIQAEYDRKLWKGYTRNRLVLRKLSGDKHLEPTKNRQMRRLFYEQLGVQATKLTPTGDPSLDKISLNRLLGHHDSRVVKAVRAYTRCKRYRKLHGTYIKGLRGVSIVHPQAKVWGTKSGRWSYEDIIQLVPKAYRGIFKARPGNWIIEADYKQFEIWIMAYLSNDTTLLKWLQEGKDVHMMRAVSVFGDSITRFSKERKKPLRQVGKMMGLAIQYGATPPTVWTQMRDKIDGIDIWLSDVESMIDKTYFTHPGIRSWQREMVRRAIKYDYMECPISGRRQICHGQIEPPKCYNLPVQGTAVDIIDGAITKVYKAVKRIKNSYLLFQIHDALVCDTSDPYRCARVMHKHMTAPVTLQGRRVRFDVDFKIGRNLGECESFSNLQEIKEWWQNANT